MKKQENIINIYEDLNKSTIVIPSLLSQEKISWKEQLDYLDKKIKQTKYSKYEQSMINQIDESNTDKENPPVTTKKINNVDSIDNHDHIS